MTEFLRNSRDSARCSSCENLGFLLSSWDLCDCIPRSASSTVLLLSYPEQSLTNVCEIPDTYTGKYTEEARLSSLERKNKSLLRDFVSGHKEMIVEVSHDIWVADEVYKSGRAKKGCCAKKGRYIGS